MRHVRHPWQQVSEKNLSLEDLGKRAIDIKITPFVYLGATVVIYRRNVNSLKSTVFLSLSLVSTVPDAIPQRSVFLNKYLSLNMSTKIGANTLR